MAAKDNTGNILKSGLSGAATGSALGPWGAAAGAVIGVGSALIGGNASAKANKRFEDRIQSQIDANKRWYEMYLAQDYTKRSEFQSSLSTWRDVLRRQTKYVNDSSITGGATEEAKALQKQSVTDELAGYNKNIASGASTWKDSIAQQGRSTEATLNGQRAQQDLNHAQQSAEAASIGVQAGTELAATAIANAGGKKNTQSDNTQFTNQMDNFLAQQKGYKVKA